MLPPPFVSQLLVSQQQQQKQQQITPLTMASHILCEDDMCLDIDLIEETYRDGGRVATNLATSHLAAVAVTPQERQLFFTQQ